MGVATTTTLARVDQSVGEIDDNVVVSTYPVVWPEGAQTGPDWKNVSFRRIVADSKFQKLQQR